MKNQQERPNLFILYPQSFNRDAKYKYVEINYSPSFSEIMQCMMETIPIFNNDKDPAQPGFIPLIDQPLHFQHNDQYQIQYQKKYQELTSKNKVLHFPKPKSQSKYCNVCKQHYEDYLDHIKSKTHKTQFTKNLYIKKIMSQAKEVKEKVVQTIEQQESTELQPKKMKKTKLC
ncbi:unnamed protein product [Paramecium octaurelia]|uniref:DBF4-type domain-containing protein n=1 Tax=Paramecium octaurelia TaxID=43137 RepID=A0A8S1V077_PAROT|nr:unnamed protein product [Paramecium octaurelia]